MSFIIDESSFCGAGRVDDGVLTSGIEAFVERVNTARHRGEPISLFEEAWDTLVDDERTLADVIENPLSGWPMDHDARVMFRRLFDVTPWDLCELGSAATTDAHIGGEVRYAPSICAAHVRTRSGSPTACLPLPLGQPTGARTVTVDDLDLRLHFVTDEAEHVAFFREQAASTGETEFPSLASHAFPELVFADGVWRGLRDFSKAFVEIRAKVVEHLSYLNDHAAQLYEEARADSKRLYAEMQVALNASDENSQAKANARSRRERTASFGGRDYECWWHTKIEGYQDRIHFHWPTPELDDKVLVGVMHKHLHLPGDS